MASVEELIVKLSADNTDLKRKMDASQKQVGGFGTALKGIGTIAVAGFAVAGVAAMAFGKAAFQSAEQQAQANKRLFFALKNNTAAFSELSKQAEALRAATGVDDAAIMQIQQLGATAGYSTEKIKKVTEASVELAAKTGQDLQAAYMQVNATFTGAAGRLNRLDAEFGNLTKEQLQNGAAVDLILTKYKGFAAASATETQKLASNWDEFTERLGTVTLPALNGFFSRLNTMLRMSSDESLSFWEKLTVPAVVYEDIMRQKKAFEETGRTATNYYKNLLGVNSAVAGYNALISAGDKQGAVIEPNDVKTIKDAKSALDQYIDSMEEMYNKAQEIAAFDVPRPAIASDVTRLFGQAEKVTVATQAAPGIGGGVDALDEKKRKEADYTQFEQQEYSKRLNALKKALEYKLITEEDYAKQVKAIDQEMNAAKMQGAYDIFANMASLFEEHTIAYKVFASAMAIMDTYKAANASYASLAGIPYVGPALGAAAAAAAIAAGLGNVAKITGAFANGGIVGGSSFSGDMLTARVNSGEMILNGNQQRELFAMANGQGRRNQVEVVGYISGDVIRLANKRSERSKQLTG